MITIIAAMDRNRVIGISNRLPWSIPEDLKNFRNLTSGKAVIMGRKTFESIGRPLPNRTNIVVSRTLEPREGVVVARNLEEAIALGREKSDEVCIIGGQSIYEQALPIADRMCLSFVKKEYQGDAFFPSFSDEDWELVKKEDRGDFEYREYVRKRR